MTCNKLTRREGAVIMVLCRIIHLSKHIRKKYPNMEREQRLENAVVICREMNKIRKKEAGCNILTRQDFHDGNALIYLYALERWY